MPPAHEDNGRLKARKPRGSLMTGSVCPDKWPFPHLGLPIDLSMTTQSIPKEESR